MDALIQPAVTFDLPRSRLRPSASGSFSVIQSHTKRTQLHSLTPLSELHSPSWCASDLAKRLVKLDLSKADPAPARRPCTCSASGAIPHTHAGPAVGMSAMPRRTSTTPRRPVDLGPSIGLRGECRMHMTASLQLDGDSCNPDHG